MNLRVASVTLAILALGFGSFAATRAYYGQSTCAMWELTALHDFLTLTDRQRKALAKVDCCYLAPRKQLRENVWREQAEFLDVLRDPKSSEEDAIRALDELLVAQRAIQVNTVSYIMQLRKYLAPQQKEKLFVALDRGMCALTGGCGWPESDKRGLERPKRQGL